MIQAHSSSTREAGKHFQTLILCHLDGGSFGWELIILQPRRIPPSSYSSMVSRTPFHSHVHSLPSSRLLGDGIDFWSHIASGDNGQYVMQLDGGPLETVVLNMAEPNPRVPIWQKSGLLLGDHELTGRFVSTGSGGVGYLDSFSCVATSVVCGHCLSVTHRVHNTQYATDGFDLKSIGPAALGVPSNAIVVDNEDPTVSYKGQWTHGNGVRFYQQTTAWTTTPGDSFTFHFTGTAIWYAH
jgi:hypothetical protein